MTKKELIKRYIFFAIGLFVSAFGVSFITKANLGTSPISSIPYVLSLGFKPTLGQFTIYFSLLLVVLQVLILRGNFKIVGLLQIPVSVVFGYFIDISMWILTALNPELYIWKLVSLLIGCAVLGTGIYMEVIANVAMLPGESFVNAWSITFHTDFGITKVVFDCAMTATAIIISVVLFHSLQGVREGTVIAALLVGMIARFLGKRLKFVENIFK